MMKRFFSKPNRALLSELVRTDFKLRYQDSVLGYTWSLLHPLLLFLVLYVVFVKFLKLGDGIPHYPVYLLMGIVMWNFFNETTMQSITSIVSRVDLIRTIRIPRWMVVFSSTISALINFGLNLVVVALFMAINHVSLSASMLLLPFIFLEVYLLALGVSLFLSAAFVKYRDVNYIWEVILQAGFYATPILYPLSVIASLTLQKVLLLNPMAQSIQDARYVSITDKTITIHSVFEGGWYQFIPFIIVIVILLCGLVYFRKESKYFAENI